MYRDTTYREPMTNFPATMTTFKTFQWEHKKQLEKSNPLLDRDTELYYDLVAEQTRSDKYILKIELIQVVRKMISYIE